MMTNDTNTEIREETIHPKQMEEKMNNQTNEELNWNEALDSGKYVSFKDGTTTIIKVQNARLTKKSDPKDAKAEPKTAFTADVTEINGEECESILDSTSIKLLLALKPIFSNPDGSMRKETVKLQVMRVGEAKNTVFSVKELPLK